VIIRSGETGHHDRLERGRSAIGGERDDDRPAWREHIADGKPAGFYNDVSVVAHHVIGVLSKGETEEVASVFKVVEELLDEPLTDRAHGVLVIGFIEDIQNISSHTGPLGSSAFVPFLGPKTKEAWAEVHRSWGTTDT